MVRLLEPLTQIDEQIAALGRKIDLLAESIKSAFAGGVKPTPTQYSDMNSFRTPSIVYNALERQYYQVERLIVSHVGPWLVPAGTTIDTGKQCGYSQRDAFLMRLDFYPVDDCAGLVTFYYNINDQFDIVPKNDPIVLTQHPEILEPWKLGGGIWFTKYTCQRIIVQNFDAVAHQFVVVFYAWELTAKTDEQAEELKVF